MKYTHLPRPLDISFYKECEREFIALTHRLPDIHAVYTGGTVSHPGISDLDFLIVVRDELSQPLLIEEQLTPRLRQIISGGSVLKVNESNIANVKIIDDFPLTHLTGKKYVIKEYDFIWHDICRVLDWLPERLLRLSAISAAGECDVTRTLQLLKSVTVSVAKVDELMKTSISQSFIVAVQKLRQEWFATADASSHIESLLAQAITISVQALNEFDGWLQAEKYIIAPPQTSALPLEFSIRGGPRWQFGQRAQVEGKNITVPWTVLAFLVTQANNPRGFISQKIKASFSVKAVVAQEISIHPALAEAIAERMAYVEKLATFFRQHQLQRGLLKYGWFLN